MSRCYPFVVGLILLAVANSLIGQESRATKAPQQVADINRESPLVIAVEAMIAERKLNQDVWTALQQPIALTLDDVSQGEALKSFSTLIKVPIRLHDEGNFDQARMTLTTHQPQPALFLLNRLARTPLDSPKIELNWTIQRGEVLVFNSSESSPQFPPMETRIYAVGKLLRATAQREAMLHKSTNLDSVPRRRGKLADRGRVPVDELVNLIVEMVPVGWTNSGRGFGTISGRDEQLIVRHTAVAHQRVARLLQALEAIQQPVAGHARSASLEVDGDVAEHARLQRLLDQEIEVTFDGASLEEVVATLRKLLKIDIVVEPPEPPEPIARGKDGLPIGNPPQPQPPPKANVPLGRYTARQALTLALAPFERPFLVYEGTLWISTQQKSRNLQRTVIYDVSDLQSGNLEHPIEGRSVTEAINAMWEDTHGHGGQLTEHAGGLFVIRQFSEAHVAIELLFHDLRRLAGSNVRNPSDVEPRFLKARSNDEALALERMLLTFVAPKTWDVNGGAGVLRVAEDRLIIRQSKTVHEQIDKFLTEYRQAKPLGARQPEVQP
ncbi:MAG: hypothetical protein ACKV2Q_20750 [Planctomycetaceae bacterium]